MKILVLAIKQIKNIYIRNKLFFWVFTISFFACTITLGFMYGYFQDRMMAKIKSDMERRRVTVVFNEENTDYSFLDNVFEKYSDEIEEIKITSSSIFIKAKTEGSDKQIKIDIISYMPKEKKYIVLLGRYFTDKEREDGDNVAIMTQLYVPDYNNLNKVGSEININGTAFKIIGVSDFFSMDNYNANEINMDSQEIYLNAQIPYNTLKKHNLPLIRVSFVVSEKLYKSFEMKIREILDKQHANSYEIQLGANNKNAESQFLQSMLEAMVIISLAVINMMMIYKYLIEIRAKEFAIMRIVGANENSIIKLIFMELFAILIITYSIAMTINKLLLVPLYYYIGVYITYRFIDYVIIFLLLFCIASIPIIPTLFRSILSSPARNRQHTIE